MNDLFEIMSFIGTAVWQVWPLFLISIILSVLIRALKLDGVIRGALNANVGKAILLATLVGAFSPFCSCTVVPVIAGLLLSGVPLAPIMSFWIASPTMDPEIFTLSVGILGWPLALARLGATLVVSLAAGYLTLALTKTSWFQHILSGGSRRTAATTSPQLPIPVYSFATSTGIQVAQPVTGVLAAEACDTGTCSIPYDPGCDKGSCDSSTISRSGTWRDQLATSFQQIEWSEFGREVAKQSWSLGRWLLLAFAMEAIITRYVPQATIAGILGDGNLFAVPMAALIGIPLYLNNFSALPIVSGLLAQGMQPGAAIAFLIAGPVTTIPAMTAVYGVVEKRIFALYLSVSILGAILMGIFANIILA